MVFEGVVHDFTRASQDVDAGDLDISLSVLQNRQDLVAYEHVLFNDAVSLNQRNLVLFDEGVQRGFKVYTSGESIIEVI